MKYMLIILLLLIGAGSYFLCYKYTNRSDASVTIIYVPGIKTDVEYSDPWKEYLRAHYPNANLTVIEGRYEYSDYDVLDQKEQEIISALQTGVIRSNPVVVLTHSYGGILAKAAIDEFMPEKVTLITMAAPFDPSLTDITESKNQVSFIYGKPDYETFTYGGRFDTVVGPENAALPDTPYQKLLSNHTLFIFPWLPMFSGVRNTIHQTIMGEKND